MTGFWLLMAAGALSLFGAFFHGVVGGRMYMNNINNTDLEPLSKSLSLVNWHIFSAIAIFSISLCCAQSALAASEKDSYNRGSLLALL